jgi:iron(III) transport system substrate-binding protein
MNRFKFSPSHARPFALSLVILVVAAACGGNSGTASPTPAAATTAVAAATATQDPWAAVLAAAKNDGKATVLTTEIPGWVDAQTAAFKQASGLDMVVAARGANGVLETRLTAEVQAGAVQTDVYEDVDRAFFAAHSDWFVDLSTAGLPNYASYPAGAKFKTYCADDKWDVSGVTYNSNLVGPNDVPKTWADLIDPKWKGKVIVSDPKPGGFYLQWALIMRGAFGPTYLQGVAALNPTFNTSSVGASQTVGSGAKSLSFLSQVDSGTDAAKAGAPIKFQLIRNPDVGSQACVGILKNAPHPAAAKVLLNYLLSADSQSAACKAGVPNVSPLNAAGCYQIPADFKMPQVNDKGVFPGMDDDALKAQAIKELGE